MRLEQSCSAAGRYHTGDTGPAGGSIGRDRETGEPDGVIVGRNELVEREIPPLDEEELEKGVRLACLEYLSYGITTL